MPSVAVVGASNRREKFGNKCVRAYLRAGWTVYPINPREDMIEGLPVFRSVADLPCTVERVSLYVTGDVVEPMLESFVKAGVRDVFFNPGTEDLGVMDKARDLGLRVHEACAIVDIDEQP